MAVNAKGKRKIVVNEKVYWWFVAVNGYGKFAHIISDDKTFIAECHLEGRKLRIEKSPNGKFELNVSMPYLCESFTPQYIKGLIELELINNICYEYFHKKISEEQDQEPSDQGGSA